jgi:hypothetical protein
VPKVVVEDRGYRRKVAGEYYDASCQDGDPDCDYVVGERLIRRRR